MTTIDPAADSIRHPYLDADPQLWIDDPEHVRSWHAYRKRSASRQLDDLVVAGRVYRHVVEMPPGERPEDETAKPVTAQTYAEDLTGYSSGWMRVGRRLAEVREARIAKRGAARSEAGKAKWTDYPPEWDGLSPEAIRKGGANSLLMAEEVRLDLRKVPERKAKKVSVQRLIGNAVKRLTKVEVPVIAEVDLDTDTRHALQEALAVAEQVVADLQAALALGALEEPKVEEPLVTGVVSDIHIEDIVDVDVDEPPVEEEIVTLARNIVASSPRGKDRGMYSRIQADLGVGLDAIKSALTAAGWVHSDRRWQPPMVGGAK